MSTYTLCTPVGWRPLESIAEEPGPARASARVLSPGARTGHGSRDQHGSGVEGAAGPTRGAPKGREDFSLESIKDAVESEAKRGIGKGLDVAKKTLVMANPARLTERTAASVASATGLGTLYKLATGGYTWRIAKILVYLLVAAAGVATAVHLARRASD